LFPTSDEEGQGGVKGERKEERGKRKVRAQEPRAEKRREERGKRKG
jgi:hypothetical protein